MRGLINRLASIDSSAERGLRVIEFFDQLVAHRADAEAITRATAVLAENTAGVVFDGIGEIHVFDRRGTALDSPGPGRDALCSEIVVDDETVGRAWLERDGAAGGPEGPGGGEGQEGHEWDELIMSRMALALAALYAQFHSDDDTRLGLANPAVLHTLLRERTSEAETARAARLLGFPAGRPVRVLAISAEDQVDAVLPALRAEVAAVTGGRTVAAAMTGNLAALITTAGPVPFGSVPPGIAVCVGPQTPVEQCLDSWTQARRGLRFAAMKGSLPRWVCADDLGCVIALADLDSGEVGRLPDVQAVTELARGRAGATDLELLDSLGRLTSVRETAAALHMHHSSVAYRITRISEVLGFDIRSWDGRYRARTALLLWQLHRSGAPL